MSQGTPLTKEFFLEVMHGVNGRFTSIDSQFKSIDRRFISIDAQFKSMNDQFKSIDDQFKNMNDQFVTIHGKLREHDDLLEMIASEVSGTQNVLNALAPVKKDHETRITRLERSFTKLILRS